MHRRVRPRAGRCRSTTSSTSTARRPDAEALVDEYKAGTRAARTISGTRVTELMAGSKRRGSSRSGCTSAPTTRGRSTARSRPARTRRCEQALAHDARGRRPGAGEGVGPARPRRRRLRAPGRSGRSCPKDVFPRYLVVNGDEGEPSTFKDRMLVERDPHQLIEGIVIAAYAIQCHHAFIYLRGEFALGVRAARRRRIADAYAHGLPRQEHPRLGLRPRDRRAPRRRRATSAGEETGLLSSPRGRARRCRASSRRSPRSQGLYAKPTVVNNVETLSTRAAHHRRWAARSTPSSA